MTRNEINVLAQNDKVITTTIYNPTTGETYYKINAIGIAETTADDIVTAMERHEAITHEIENGIKGW